MNHDPRCCHKTRIRGWPCPLGQICPYDTEKMACNEPSSVGHSNSMRTTPLFRISEATRQFGHQPMWVDSCANPDGIRD